MELYSNVVALAKGENRDKLAELPVTKLNDASREEIKNIVKELLRSGDIGTM